ncbi:hypothetical protein EON64_10115 [archaeon]|nr:MAG: hypothetical protein EON64_10115 [archaeon]
MHEVHVSLCQRTGKERDLSYLHHLHSLTGYIDDLVVGGAELPEGACIGRVLTDAGTIASVKEVYEPKEPPKTAADSEEPKRPHYPNSQPAYSRASNKGAYSQAQGLGSRPYGDSQHCHSSGGSSSAAAGSKRKRVPFDITDMTYEQYCQK